MNKLEILNQIKNKINIDELINLSEGDIARKLIELNMDDEQIDDVIDQLRDLIDPLDTMKFKVKFTLLSKEFDVIMLDFIMNNWMEKNDIDQKLIKRRWAFNCFIGTNDETIYNKLIGNDFLKDCGKDIFKIEKFEGKSRMRQAEIKTLFKKKVS